MKLNNKKSFSLIEIILSIFIMSLITVFSMTFYKDIFFTNKKVFDNELYKLKLFNTKLFLEKNRELNFLTYKNSILYFKNSPLLKEVSFYKIDENLKYYDLSICIKDKICQDMVILK